MVLLRNISPTKVTNPRLRVATPFSSRNNKQQGDRSVLVFPGGPQYNGTYCREALGAQCTTESLGPFAVVSSARAVCPPWLLSIVHQIPPVLGVRLLFSLFLVFLLCFVTFASGMIFTHSSKLAYCAMVGGELDHHFSSETPFCVFGRKSVPEDLSCTSAGICIIR